MITQKQYTLVAQRKFFDATTSSTRFGLVKTSNIQILCIWFIWILCDFSDWERFLPVKPQSPSPHSFRCNHIRIWSKSSCGDSNPPTEWITLWNGLATLFSFWGIFKSGELACNYYLESGWASLWAGLRAYVCVAHSAILVSFLENQVTVWQKSRPCKMIMNNSNRNHPHPSIHPHQLPTSLSLRLLQVGYLFKYLFRRASRHSRIVLHSVINHLSHLIHGIISIMLLQSVFLVLYKGA